MINLPKRFTPEEIEKMELVLSKPCPVPEWLKKEIYKEVAEMLEKDNAVSAND